MTNILPGTLSLNEPQIIWAKEKFCTASRPLMIGANSARAAPMRRNLISFLAENSWLWRKMSASSNLGGLILCCDRNVLLGAHHYSPQNSVTRSVIALLTEKVSERFAGRQICSTRPRFSGGYWPNNTRILASNTSARAIFRLTFYSTKSIKSPILRRRALRQYAEVKGIIRLSKRPKPI